MITSNHANAEKLIEAFKASRPEVFEEETNNELDLYQRRAFSTSMFLQGNETSLRALGLLEITQASTEFMALLYTALGLAGEAGEYADKIKKVIRDDGGDYTLKAPLLAKELGDVLWYTAVSAAVLGYRLSEIAAGNVAKLAKRYVEGKIGGSGDER